MRIDVSELGYEKVNEVGMLLQKSFPDHEISIKEKAGKVTIKITKQEIKPCHSATDAESV